MLSLKKKRSPNLLLVRVLFLIALDILVINLSAFLALYIRHEFDYGAMKASGFLDTLALFAIPNTIITLGLFWLLNLYSSLWGFAGADELIHIFVAAVLAAAVQAVVILPGLVNLPRSFPVLYAMLLCVSTMVVRFAYRFVRRLRARAGTGGREKTMLIGAGQAGALMLREFKNSSFSRNQVVCIIDDDPGYGGAQIIEVLTHQVSRQYLTYLQSMDIPYIFAGDTEIDIDEALSKLKAYFGINKLLLEGGSILNGAFQRAGVIDEVSLVVAPTVAEAEDKPLFMDARMEHYALEDVQYRNDTLWLNYKVK